MPQIPQYRKPVFARGRVVSAGEGTPDTSVTHLWVGITGAAATTGEFKGDHLSIKMFGATGDGITDDSEAIQRAIDYASANNIYLEVPVGEYIHSNTIVITGAGARLLGCLGKTIFVYTGTDSAFSAHDTSFSIERITFRSRSADGSAGNGPYIAPFTDSHSVSNPGNPTGVHVGLRINTCSRWFVKDCTFGGDPLNGFGEGIRITHSSVGTIYDCDFSWNLIGINFEAGSYKNNNHSLDNLSFYACSVAALKVQSAVDLTIRNSYCEIAGSFILMDNASDDGHTLEAQQVTASDCYALLTDETRMKEIPGSPPTPIQYPSTSTYLYPDGTPHQRFIRITGGASTDAIEIFGFIVERCRVNVADTHAVEVLKSSSPLTVGRITFRNNTVFGATAYAVHTDDAGWRVSLEENRAHLLTEDITSTDVPFIDGPAKLSGMDYSSPSGTDVSVIHGDVTVEGAFSFSPGATTDTPDESGTVYPNCVYAVHNVTLSGVVTFSAPTNVAAGKLVSFILNHASPSAPKPIWASGYQGIPFYDVSPNTGTTVVLHFIGVSAGVLKCVGIWQGYKFHKLVLEPNQALDEVGMLDLQDLSGNAVTISAPSPVSTPYTYRPPSGPPVAINQVVASKDTLGGTKWLSTSGAFNPAPNNISGASITAFPCLYGNSAAFYIIGSVDLPSDLTGLDRVRIDVIGPAPSTTMTSFFINGPFSGSIATFNTTPIYRTGVSETFSVRFTAVSSGVQKESTPYTVSLTLNAAAISSVSMVEFGSPAGSLRSNINGVCSTRLVITIYLSGDGPVMVPIRYNRGNGLGWYDLGWHQIDATGSTFTTDWIPVPSDGAMNWTPAAEVILGSAGTSTLSGVTEASLPGSWVQGTAVSISSVGSPETSIVSGASVHATTYNQDKTAWGFDYITCSVNMANPKLYSVRLMVQKGHVVSGVFYPASDAEGVKRSSAGIRCRGDLSDNPQGTITVSGTTGTITIYGDPGWGNPLGITGSGAANVDRVFRLTIEAGSVEGTQEVGGTPGGTFVTQNCWPGGADHFDITPDIPGAHLDLTKSIASTRSSALFLNTSNQLDVTIDGSRLTSIEAAIIVAASATSLHVNSEGKLDIVADASRITSITPGVVAAISNSAEFEVVDGYIQIKKLNVDKLVGNSIDVGSGGLTVTAGGSITISHNGRSSVFTSTGFNMSWGVGYLGGLACTGGATFADNAASISDLGNATFPNIYNKAAVDDLLDSYLTVDSASSTYLTISNASSTYETKTHASSTYLTITNAATTYMPIAGPSWGLSTFLYFVAADGWSHTLTWDHGILSALESTAL